MIYALVLFVLILIGAGFALKKVKKTGSFLSLTSNKVILEIKVPRVTNEDETFKTAALAMESLFSSLHGLLKSKDEGNEYFSFEVVSRPGLGIKFYSVCSERAVNFVESQIYSNYPSAQIIRVAENLPVYEDVAIWQMSKLVESKRYIFPLKTYNDMEIDSMASITSSMSQLGDGEAICFQVLAKPVGDVWQKEGNDYVSAAKTGKKVKNVSTLQSLLMLILTELWSIFTRVIGEAAMIFGGSYTAEAGRDAKGVTPTPKLTIVQEMEVNSIENKMAKMGFQVEVRILVGSKSGARVDQTTRDLVASFNQFSTTNLNSLVLGGNTVGREAYTAFAECKFAEVDSFILNVEELGSMYHLPSQEVETPNIGWSYSRKSEPPAGLPIKDCTFIADTVFRNQKVRFGLANGDDRLRHMYVIGKSGTGKSTLFETMISQDIANGFGVGVLDPHGETIDKVLERIPENRVDDVIYFDPSDTEMPVGLNLLELSDISQKNLMASALVSAIKHHFDYSWGPRLEYLLNYSILTLLEVQGTTMLGITRLLEDENYRKFILHNVSDPVVHKFWDTEFKNMKNNPKLITESIAPIQNKVNRFLASTTIRNILGQRKSTIDIEGAMNSGKILLMNLSKGKIGEDNANLLGALLVSRIQFFALQRANIRYDQRRPFYLYVDEFQNFATGSFESILSESRKYGLGLYLTHQYTAQLPEQLLKAVLGNVGTIATFSLGTPDAKALAAEFAPYFTDTDIISLERFHVYIKLMMNGMTSLPFSAKILLPWVEDECVVAKSTNKDWVLELSRQKYGVAKAEIEDKIRKWVDTNFDKGMAIAIDTKVVGTTVSPAPVKPPVPLRNPEPAIARPTPEVQEPVRQVERLPKIQAPAAEPPAAITVLDSGFFDGSDMVLPDGRKVKVQANYAAKSELAYGDILERYLHNGEDRFRQAKKVERAELEGTLYKDNGLWVFVTPEGKNYPVSQTAVDFNQFTDGQRMYGTIPAGVQDVPYCTLALKRFRKETTKSAEADKIKNDQSLR